MKRILLTLVILVLAAGTVQAEGMMFGVKGGVNLANLTGDIEDVKVKLGFGGGIWMNYAINEMFSVQPEVLFMMKGAKADVDDFDAGIRANYIEIPVLVKYSVPMEGDFGVSLFAGPAIGFLMSAEEYFEDETEDIKEYLTSTEFSLLFGAGFDYAVGEGAITFDARYSLGLNNIVDEDPEDEGDFEIKTTGIQFLVGYGFAF